MNKIFNTINKFLKRIVINKCNEKNIASKEFDKKSKINSILVLISFLLLVLMIVLSFLKSGGIETKVELIKDLPVLEFNDEDKEVNLRANVFLDGENKELDFSTYYPKEEPTDENVVDRLLAIINEDLIKNENESLNLVTSKLYLETKNAYGAQITYESKNGYINILTGDVTRKPKGTGDAKDVLKVIVSHGDVKKVKELNVTIKEDERTSSGIKIDNALRTLKELIKDKTILNNGKFISDIEGVPVSFSTIKTVNKKDYLFGVRLLILIVFLVFVLYLYESYMKIIDADKKRTEELEREFPNFIEEYMLLNKAGYTFPVAINYIASKNKKGYLSSELRRISDEISRDIILYDSLNSFAIRSGSEMIKKFILGLSSNLKRGSSHMNLFLSKELELSNIERKNKYEKRASENSTKAIMPLLLILIATMLMVVYPATLALKM